MNIDDTLEKEIKTIWEILILAKECYEYANYFYKPMTLEETGYINNSTFFKFTRQIFLRVTVIELCKLLPSTKNDKFNLPGLIKKLSKTGEYNCANISENILEQWNNYLIMNDKKIKDLKNLRDKIYTHHDSNASDVCLKDINLEDLRDHITFIEGIITVIYRECFDTEAIVTRPIFFHNSRFDIVRILAEEKGQRNSKILNEIMNRKNS